MGRPDAFFQLPRVTPQRRPVAVRLRDWREVYEAQTDDEVREQASRCMDCGIPFCHHGCPLGNLIPEWNDLTYRGRWDEAIDRLHSTNNFPEFTGRLCPAPCESACVAGLGGEAVSIERTEYEIAEHAWSLGLIQPTPPREESGKRVAVIGSGPAGLAAAQQLRRAGHQVTVYERADAPGGLLRYGIPEFKMEKAVLDRRLNQMRAEGVVFECSTEIGRNESLAALRARYDGVVVAIGATKPRELDIERRPGANIFFAVDFLTAATQSLRGLESSISAAGHDVVILGGGDTGADCLGTVHRQGARQVEQLEILPQPPSQRPASSPWPTMPVLYRVTSAHEEGGNRRYAVRTVGAIYSTSGHLEALEVEELDYSGDAPTPVGRHTIPCTMLLIAAGFVASELEAFEELQRTDRGAVAVDSSWVAIPGAPGLAPVVAAGDAVRGQSLIVWAIAEGRSAAAALHSLLGGAPIPAPLVPYAQQW